MMIHYGLLCRQVHESGGVRASVIHGIQGNVNLSMVISFIHQPRTSLLCHRLKGGIFATKMTYQNLELQATN